MIGIVGAGAFGTALAIALGREGRSVTFWTRDSAHANDLTRHRCNDRYLPGATIPASVAVTSDLSALRGVKTVLIALPMQQLAGFVQQHAATFAETRLVACCKGVDLASLNGPTRVIAAACPGASTAILTGPSFAADIARGLPTALTLACKDPDMAESLQATLSTPVLRLYRTTDVVGAELGGALKNVIAIACGACIGQGMGDSARAALMTRGMAEMMRLATALGGRADTLMGLSGFGDLVLTCTSEQSRNFRFGLALGRGEGFDPGMTVEGAATAHAVARLAHQRKIDLPITQMLAGLLEGRSSVAEAIQALLARPLKQE